MIYEIRFDDDGLTVEEVLAFKGAVETVLKNRLNAKNVRVDYDFCDTPRKELIDIARCGISSIMADATDPDYVEGLIEETLGIGLSTVQDIAPDLYAEIAEGVEE